MTEEAPTSRSESGLVFLALWHYYCGAYLAKKREVRPARAVISHGR